MSEITDLEREFIDELKGEGSLSVYLKRGDETEYIGYDINPEDVSAIYFEGIGVPRWESLQAETVEQQTAMYWERFNERMADYPAMNRLQDTDKRIEYSAEDARRLVDECNRIASAADNPKAVRALQKLTIAANRAVGSDSGLDLQPSQSMFSGF